MRRKPVIAKNFHTENPPFFIEKVGFSGFLFFVVSSFDHFLFISFYLADFVNRHDFDYFLKSGNILKTPFRPKKISISAEIIGFGRSLITTYSNVDIRE